MVDSRDGDGCHLVARNRHGLALSAMRMAISQVCCEKTKTVRPLSDTKATTSLAMYAAVIPFLLSCCSQPRWRCSAPAGCDPATALRCD